MARSVRYNGTPIEQLSKNKLIAALEAVCAQLEEQKQSAVYWKEKFDQIDEGPLSH